MKKICVIGSNSFSGQDFIDLLLEKTDYKILGISRSNEKDDLFLSYKLNPNLNRFRFFAFDLNRNMVQIIEMLDNEKPSYIVNFAAQSEVAPSWEHPEHWFQTNSVALCYLVNHLRKAKYLEKYLHVSSPEVYGSCNGVVKEDAPFNPSTPYAASKASADMLLSVFRKQFDFPLVTVRSTNVYGARQPLFKIIPRTAIYLRLGKKIELHGGGVAVKSYIHIRDISNGELAILEKGQAGRTYHLSPDSGVSIRDVVGLICQSTNSRFEDAVNIVDERPGQDAAYVIDSSLARTELNWRPEISLENGIVEVLDWVERYWHEIQYLPLDYLHKP